MLDHMADTRQRHVSLDHLADTRVTNSRAVSLYPGQWLHGDTCQYIWGRSTCPYIRGRDTCHYIRGSDRVVTPCSGVETKLGLSWSNEPPLLCLPLALSWLAALLRLGWQWLLELESPELCLLMAGPPPPHPAWPPFFSEDPPFSLSFLLLLLLRTSLRSLSLSESFLRSATWPWPCVCPSGGFPVTAVITLSRDVTGASVDGGDLLGDMATRLVGRGERILEATGL